MKKLTILFALLTLCAGLWAINNVPYIDANGQVIPRAENKNYTILGQEK